jgi:hypothetical protein
MPLIQDDHMIEQATTTVADPALGDTVLFAGSGLFGALRIPLREQEDLRGSF